MKMRKSQFSGAAALLAGVLSVWPAYGDIANGGFESGTFAGWSTTGDSSVVTSAFGTGPVTGTFQALVEGGAAGVTVPSLEDFLGVPGGSLDALGNGIAHGGSAIQQTFTATAGQTLTFDWDFITDEAPPSIFDDFAFWSLSSLSTLAFANQTGLIPFNGLLETGFQQTSVPLPGAGTYTLALGVANVSDLGGLPQLLVDDVTLANSIPEPAYAPPLALLGAALLGAKLVARLGR